MKSFCCLLLLMLGAVSLWAQPSRDRVLGDVEFSEYPEKVEISVAFNFPIRYLGHFPTDTGTELRIQLQPINIAAVDQGALFHRESFGLVQPNLAGISALFYEGDMDSGLYLTLRFRSQAHWQVVTGEDYRSVLIRVLSPFPTMPRGGEE
jgi:hypothetical protein